MAARSVSLNDMTGIISVHTLDMLDAAASLGYGAYSVAVCNPPYCKAGGALSSQSESQRIARHEGALLIKDVAAAAAQLLKVGGRFYTVFPAARLLDLTCALRQCRLEPKRIRTVHDRIEKAPKLILLDAVKCGGSQLHWMPPLIMNDDNGNPSDEWRRVYRISTPGL
jgi:tRNA1Val (adenine37-N6)-methyltransferase